MIAPKGQSQSDERSTLVRARVTALVFGLLTLVSLLFLVYAFIQRAEAEKNMLEAQRQQQLYNTCQMELQQAVEAKEAMRSHAEEERMRAEALYQASLQELEKAKLNRK